MGMSPVALVAERRQIAAIIASDPVSIVLRRRDKVSTPDNSWVWGSWKNIYLPGKQGEPQRFAMIPFKRRLTDMLVNTELGDVERVPYTLVGYHDADIQRNDEFQIGEQRFKVEWIDIKTQVRTTAGIDYLGGDPRAD